MPVWIALFRGINVGGNRSLPMRELVPLLEELGFADIRTYIQSGNVVFRSDRTDAAAIGEDIGAAVGEVRGFRPQVLLMTVAALERAAAGNPFPEAEAEPKSLHLWFLADPPESVDEAALDRLRAEEEAYALEGAVFYLHAPNGIGRSKLAEKVETLVGRGTARNWRTVTCLLEMARVAEAGCG